MKIDKVMIVIQTTDEEFASVRLVTDPAVDVELVEDLEETPAVLLGSALWNVVQDFLETDDTNVRSIQ